MSAEASSTSAPLPLFYRTPTLLRFPDHRDVGLRENTGFGFAANAAAIPLLCSEFLQAQRSYPIVFSMDEGAMPLAVVGLDSGINLFVGANGVWAADHYVPAHVRRYPFIGVASSERGTTMLGLDFSAPHVSMDAALDNAGPLFTEAGAPTEPATVAMAFCDAFALDFERTRAFSQALEAENLLIAREARAKFPDGTEKLVQGFRLIDEPRFRALPDAALKTFHANGWSDLIVLHLASQASWQNLVSRARKAS